jgi:hypothetical protein
VSYFPAIFVLGERKLPSKFGCLPLLARPPLLCRLSLKRTREEYSMPKADKSHVDSAADEHVSDGLTDPRSLLATLRQLRQEVAQEHKALSHHWRAGIQRAAFGRSEGFSDACLLS